MIKKIQSLLFSGQKNKEDQKKAAKANEDTIEQFIEGDNLPIDEFSKKHEIDKRKEPPTEEMDSLINLYSEGKFSETLSLINELLNQFPYSVDLYNVAGASNAGLKNFDASIRD